MTENGSNEVIKRIVKRREELGFSYQDLANRTGINKSTLMRYEKGIIKNLSLDKLELIAKALNVSPAYLMGWEAKDEKKVNNFDTIAAHLEDKKLTPQKIKLLQKYIDALFDDED